MNPDLHNAPTLDADAAGLLVPAEFDSLWSAVQGLSNSWRNVEPTGYLSRWAGCEVSSLSDGRLLRVHHIGVYMGDYDAESDALAWNEYLLGLADQGRVAAVEIGPSYIAPRQYGTQGWLSSVTLCSGAVLETFTCKRYGRWKDLTIKQRQMLMSHAALQVQEVGDVRFVLDGVAGRSRSTEIIAFTESDEFGHTYGHLRNNTTGSVVEIVHQGPVPGRPMSAFSEGVT